MEPIDRWVPILGGDVPALPHRTEVRIAWTPEALFFRAWLEEPHLRARLTEHNATIWHDPAIEIFLDPDDDGRLYFEYEVNALGTTWDLLMTHPYRDGGFPLSNYELHGTRTAVALRGTLNDASDLDEGWQVDVAFPWTSLADFAPGLCPPSPGDRWRMNLMRVQWPTEIDGCTYVQPEIGSETYAVWCPQDAVDMHRPETWGFLQFGE